MYRYYVDVQSFLSNLNELRLQVINA